MIDHAWSYDLLVTFHRAFDATPDWRHSMDTIITMGINRVLSSDMKWGGPGTALDGINQLADMIEFAAGGGANHTNASVIISELRESGDRFSQHAYNFVLEGDRVSSEKVALLKVLRSHGIKQIKVKKKTNPSVGGVKLSPPSKHLENTRD